MEKWNERTRVAIERIHKLLRLARGGATEEEADQAMRRVHGLLAEHNLSLREVEARPDREDRILDNGTVDGSRELWPTQVWNATARLHFCGYFYTRELDGECWIGLRHTVFGRRHNVTVAKMMSEYLVATVNRLSREASREIAAHERRRYGRSFRIGCTERLVQRISCRQAEVQSTPTVSPSGNTLPALRPLYEVENKGNEELLRVLGITTGKGEHDRHCHAGGREAGRQAAETICLEPQIAGPGRRAAARAVPRQRDLFGTNGL